MTPVITERLALRTGVYSVRAGDGTLYLTDGRAVESMGRLGDSERDALRRLAGSAPAQAPPDLLHRLRAGGWLTITVHDQDRPLYALVPWRRPPEPIAAPEGELVLSRHALLRRVADRLVLESPRAWCTVEIHDPGLVGDMTTRPVVRDRLWWAGMLERPHDGDAQLRHRQWSPHELWFHDRSRRPGADGGFGGTWWAREDFQPLPAVREPYPGPVVRLDRPDLVTVRAGDPPLTEVIEDRRTVREHDDASPLTAGQLGEFLYRCCRNRARWTDDGVEQLRRPYPAGGSLHELEVYLAIQLVTGLDPGVYHYQPDRHRLALVTGPGTALDRLLGAAVRSAALPRPPQLVLVIAARFGRLMWKYQAIGYRLVLMHVGVLYQVMYSVATAMGLAGCALGGGDPEAFRLAAGVDPLEEDSVGEFLLGSRPATVDQL